MNEFAATPQEQPCATATMRRKMTIGLPASEWAAERRFPLTPEGCEMLIGRGFRIIMQQGAPADINYTDSRYARRGVEIATRQEAWGADIVISPAPASRADIGCMRRGAMLLTLMRPEIQDPAALRLMLDRHIVSIALDLVKDSHGCRPFADILAEIDGRAATTLASAILADPLRGKGILLGGVAGIVPCEILIVGSGLAAQAAARSAIGLGAMVRMYDNDVYALRSAMTTIGPALITSSLHPHTLGNALRSADVVIVTPTETPFVIDRDEVASMKKGVLCFDLTSASGKAFPSLTAVDLALASALNKSSLAEGRMCFVNAGCGVARTAAMALSNTLVKLLADITECDGVQNAIRLLPGIQCATLTFFGRAVNPHIAARAAVRCVDLSIFLSLS
ncbi:MAG: hypothetical protein K2G35_05940 [Duncaniella sp.]|nr:hypothetical protein [Duncaniella sp.]